MSLLNFDGAPFDKNMLGDINDMLSPQHQESVKGMMSGGGKLKKRVKRSTKGKKVLKKTSTKKTKITDKKKKIVKKKKVVTKKVLDTWSKDKLVKIAKKHGVSLKGRDGKPKTKALLYRSLKRRGLV